MAHFFVKITVGGKMKLSDIDYNKVTPMMRQYIDIKKEHPDILIFFRLGDFYEAFFEDALLASRELELTLTGRSAGLSERVPMCGVPHHAVNIYIEKLVDKGYRVGLCEQLEDPASAKGIVERGLTQIISKGTVMNSESLKENDFNYIANLLDFDHAYAVSYADITTGLIYVMLLPHNNTKLISEIVTLNVQEIVVESKIDSAITSILKNQFKMLVTVSDEIDSTDTYIKVYEGIEDERLIKTIKHLLKYVTNMQMKTLEHMQHVIIKENKNVLKMDMHTKRNLELTETLRLKQRNYSLIWLLDKTKTAMGSRMLKNYIENPLININEINKRYDVVETLLEEFILKDDLKNLLYEVYDLERLSGRVAFGNANARDLLQLRSSLAVLPDINNILGALKYTTFNPLPDLLNLLNESIYDNPPVGIKEGFLIKEGYSAELDELKSLRKGGKDFVARFEADERERTGIKTLKVGYNKVFGYYIEVSKGMTGMVKDEYGYERKQTLSNCERYISPILKEKEALILNAEERIIELEYQLFIGIRDKVKEYIPALQEISRIISEIDVLQSFATVSEENNYTRPKLTDKRFVSIIEGRHAVVEKVLDSEYVNNDIIFNEDTDILLITGPNMAGKSTYMRQFAITVIMAQIGCFVPAKEAIMPVFDAIYTRIGASDDLVSGESTFMVEMKEANDAISNATKNSLVLFDELGRGTATFDGMALAQSIIEYLHDNIHCKTMFSTHYHELTDLENTLSHLRNIHVSAYEEDGNITFLHKIEKGSVDKSYGIHVARLANLPKNLIERATTILAIYEANEKKRDVKVQQALPLDSLIEKKDKLREELDALDPLQVTPMDALNILVHLKELSKKDG